MRVKISAALCLLSAALANAQTADEIVARAIEARGGANKMSATGSMKITGMIVVGQNPPGPITVYAKRPNLFRVELTVGPDKIVQGFDGTTGWQMVSGEHAQPTTKLTGDPLNRLIDQAANAIDGPLFDYRARNIKVALLGRGKLDKSDAYMLRVTLPTGSIIDQYLDATSYLEVYEELPAIPVKQRVSDYRRYGGVLYPCLYTSEVQKLEMQNREINPKLDPALFAMPQH